MTRKHNLLILVVFLAMVSIYIAYVKTQSRELPSSIRSETKTVKLPQTKKSPMPDSVSNQALLESIFKTGSEENASALSSFDELINAWQENLTSSNHPHDQFLAFLFAKDRESRELFLLQAYGLDPNDLLINKAVMRFCRKHADSPLCELPYLALLEKEEADNLQFHLELAVYAFEDGNIEEAMKRLERGTTTEKSDLYGWRQTEIIDASLNRFGVARGFRSYGAVMGMVHAIAWPGYLRQVHQNLCSYEAMQNSQQTSNTCKKIYHNILQKETDITTIAVATTGYYVASGLTTEDARNRWRTKSKETYLPITDRVMSAYGQLVLQTANTLGIDPNNPEINPSDFEHVEIPISDVIWSEFIERNKSQGHDQASVWLLERLMEVDIVYSEEK